MTSTQKEQKNKNISVNVAQTRVISYLRVSTTAQDKKDKSGFGRQVQDREFWLANHSDCFLDKEIRHTGSGAKAGRFDDVIREYENGTYEKGTILLVESIDRFSREKLDDSLWTLLRFFRAGGKFACCDLNNGEIFDSIGSDKCNVFMIIGAMQNARSYWERRQKWKVGSLKNQQRDLEKGYLGKFTRRGKDQVQKDYPSWLSFNPDLIPPKGFSGGWWDIDEKQAQYIKEIFELAPNMGMRRIATEMAKRGMMDIKKRRPANKNDINAILNNKAVLGIRAETHVRKQTKTGKDFPCYPAIITQTEWDLAHLGKSNRNASRENVINGSSHRNLFEGRLFCASCGSLIGVRTSQIIGDKEYIYMRCNGKNHKHQCNSLGKAKYNEDKLLDRFQNFHWDKYFADKKHDQQLINKRKALQEFEREFRVVETKIINIEKTILNSIETNTEVDLNFLYKRKKDLEDEKESAKFKVTRCGSDLNKIERTKTGRARANEIKSKINDFINSDKKDIENRKNFISFLHSENLVMTIDFNWDGTPFNKGEIGIGKLDQSGKLIEIDSTIENLTAWGLDPEEARKLFDEHQERKENRKAQQEEFAQTAEGKRLEKFKNSDTWKEWEEQRKQRNLKIKEELREKNNIKEVIKPKNKYEWFELTGQKYSKRGLRQSK